MSSGEKDLTPSQKPSGKKITKILYIFLGFLVLLISVEVVFYLRLKQKGDQSATQLEPSVRLSEMSEADFSERVSQVGYWSEENIIVPIEEIEKYEGHYGLLVTKVLDANNYVVEIKGRLMKIGLTSDAQVSFINQQGNVDLEPRDVVSIQEWEVVGDTVFPSRVEVLNRGIREDIAL